MFSGINSFLGRGVGAANLLRWVPPGTGEGSTPPAFIAASAASVLYCSSSNILDLVLSISSLRAFAILGASRAVFEFPSIFLMASKACSVSSRFFILNRSAATGSIPLKPKEVTVSWGGVAVVPIGAGVLVDFGLGTFGVVAFCTLLA
ncbi:hypothetical protein [uncultured Mediterranean phage]|nr:hypothetical protein [uncultured Mediterranean phage]